MGTELNLRSGAVSKALFGKAGAKLQDLLTAERQGKQVEDGSIFVTDGCNLSCDIVIHAVVPEWDGGNGSSEKVWKWKRDCSSRLKEQITIFLQKWNSFRVCQTFVCRDSKEAHYICNVGHSI